jgi:hypothetical protein
VFNPTVRFECFCKKSGERFARVARWAIPLEYHFVATWLKTTWLKTTWLKAIWLKALDPAHEGGSTVEKRRLADHADEGNLKTCRARMIQNLSAIVQCAIDPGNREQPELRQIFL